MLYRIDPHSKTKVRTRGREELPKNRHAENGCLVGERGSLDGVGRNMKGTTRAMDKGERMFSEKARKIEELTTQGMTKNNRKMVKTASEQVFAKHKGTVSSQMTKHLSPAGFSTAPENMRHIYANTQNFSTTPKDEEMYPFKHITSNISSQQTEQRKLLTSPKRLPQRQQQLSLERSKTQQSKSKDNLFKKRQVQKVKTQQAQPHPGDTLSEM